MLPGFENQCRREARDPNLDHPAVMLYRRYCRLTANHVQRREIVATVENNVRELKLFEQVLYDFMCEGCNPKRVDWLLDRFEETLRNPKRGAPL